MELLSKMLVFSQQLLCITAKFDFLINPELIKVIIEVIKNFVKIYLTFSVKYTFKFYFPLYQPYNGEIQFGLPKIILKHLYL